MSKKKDKKYKPVVLIILDGWGVSPPSEGNAVLLAKTPNFDNLIKNYPHCTILAAGEPVGLTWQEVGNSEVGHMNIGAGRVMYQELPRIDKSISDGSFFQNEAILQAFNHVKKNRSDLHIMGVVSSGAVHGHINHLLALLEFVKREKINRVFIHFFADGRDAPQKSALDFIEEVENKAKEIKLEAPIATVTGRFYSMDRNQNWDRTQKAYEAMVLGKGLNAYSAEETVKQQYKKNIFDEMLMPTVIIDKNQKPKALIKDNDAAIFFNYRGDRARQLTKAFVLPGFEKFKRDRLKNFLLTTFTEYEKALPVEIAFVSQEVKNILAEVVSSSNLRQFHIAETEKYAHVTFFFNCGREEPFPKEERKIITSPAVVEYDEQPEMSAYDVTDVLVKRINSGIDDFIVVNYANPDMVGHTANIPATVEAIETVDECLGRVIETILDVGGAAVIVADHGNAEVLRNLQTGEPDKNHTANPVPFILVADNLKTECESEEMCDRDLSILPPYGVLADVAPTVLKLMGIDQPIDMTGTPLLI